MVDTVLPIEQRARPLRHLFVDLNSYFASVEQQVHPELRGRPVAVGAVNAETGTIIAASYEAKAYGIRCGTMVREAKALCPDIVLMSGSHGLYSEYHDRIVEAVESVLPVEEVCSIDEMRCRLLGDEREPENARAIARKVKAAIREVGEALGCSVGIAPNGFLAKIGTELQKPDGLVVIEAKDLPHCLHSLKPTDLPGINRRMSARLKAAGIFTVADLTAADRQTMIRAFGGVVGERWWYLLQGFDLAGKPTHRRSLGHSHVLPPNLRTDQGCREVMLRLLQKASARLRRNKLWAGSIVFSVRGMKRSWSVQRKFSPTQDSVTMTDLFVEEWESRDFMSPLMASVTLLDLKVAEQVTPSLFDNTGDQVRLSHTIDQLNLRFGKNHVFLAGLAHAKDTAQERIAFQKTELFYEGAT